MKSSALVLALAVAGCVTTEPATRGSVYAFNGDTVTIRGAYNMDGTSKPAEPTAAMIAQAREVCPGAQYLSATPYPEDYYTFLYLFRC